MPLNFKSFFVIMVILVSLCYADKSFAQGTGKSNVHKNLPSVAQRSIVKEFKTKFDPDIQINWEQVGDKTVASFVVAKSLSVPIKGTPEEIARKWLSETSSRALFAEAEDVNVNLKFKGEMKDKIGMSHVRFTQDVKNIPVFGASLNVHIKQTEDEGIVKSVNGRYLPGVDINTKPDIQFEQAAENALEFSRNNDEDASLIKDLSGQLNIYFHEGEYRLVWLVDVLGQDGKNPAAWKCFVDAHSGEVLHRYNDIKFILGCSQPKPVPTPPVPPIPSSPEPAIGTGIGVLGDRKPLNTYDNVNPENTRFSLIDETRTFAGSNNIRTYDMHSNQIESGGLPGTLFTDSDNDWDAQNERAAVDAHNYAGVVYDYFSSAHNWNSLDGSGNQSIISSVHCCSKFGCPWGNAAWWRGQMLYGDGDGTRFATFSGSLDIVAHELTHAITDNTADLIYQFQSGALNESFSDVFACMVDNDDWEVGETVFTPGIPGDALRSLENPPIGGQPDHMNDYLNTGDDNGGVHTNSGIPNKAAFLIAAGGTHSGIVVNGIGKR